MLQKISWRVYMDRNVGIISDNILLRDYIVLEASFIIHVASCYVRRTI